MMRLKWPFRRTPTGEIPTVDYYLLAAVGDLVRAEGAVDATRPIERRGPHLFTCGDRAVVIRYVTGQELEVLAGPNGKWSRVYYVVDDLLLHASRYQELPASYRKRIATFVAGPLQRLLALGPTVVAPRQEVLDQFGAHAQGGELLPPCAITVAADHSHFDGLSQGGPLRAAFLGTRSHQAGLAQLAEVLRLVEPACPGLTVTLFQGRHLPRALRRSRVVRNRDPLAWPHFRQLLARERFHLVLAPLPPTPFNAGRSTTKILDAAAVGAAGLYSAREPFLGAVTHTVDGLLAADDPAAWAEAIKDLSAHPDKAAAIASGGAALARRIGDPVRVREFWLSRLVRPAQ